MTGVCILPVIQTSVNFSIFNLRFLRWYYTWNAETLQGFYSKDVLSTARIRYFLILANFTDLIEFPAAVLEKGLLAVGLIFLWE